MTKWKEPALPRHVVQMLVMDKQQRVLMMHRSDRVRSAPNVWSIPSGEHDIGETMEEAINRELHEEYGFTDIEEIDEMFTYENIAGDTSEEQYHWVITVFLVMVDDITVAVNREPEKHDKLEFVDLMTMLHNDEWKSQHIFHPSLDKVILTESRRYFDE